MLARTFPLDSPCPSQRCLSITKGNRATWAGDQRARADVVALGRAPKPPGSPKSRMTTLQGTVSPEEGQTPGSPGWKHQKTTEKMTFKENIYHLLVILMRAAPVLLHALTCWLGFFLRDCKEQGPSIFGPEIMSKKQKGGGEEARSRV